MRGGNFMLALTLSDAPFILPRRVRSRPRTFPFRPPPTTTTAKTHLRKNCTYACARYAIAQLRPRQPLALYVRCAHGPKAALTVRNRRICVM